MRKPLFDGITPAFELDPETDTNDEEQIVLQPIDITAFNLTSENLCYPLKDPSSFYLRVSLLLFAAAFVMPHRKAVHNWLFRCVITVAIGCHVIYTIEICSPDIMFWNCIFLVINGIQFLCSIVNSYPTRLRKEHMALYKKFFEIFKVDKTELQIFARAASTRRLRAGDVFAEEGCTRAGSNLTMLISGRVVATHHDIFLHDIRAFQMLNAIEWNWFDDEADFDRCYEVTLRATEDSVFMSWTKNQLLQARQCLPEVLSVLLQITANDALRQIYFVANDGQESTREVATISVPTVSYQNV